MCAQIISKSACKFSPVKVNYITDSNKTFRIRSRGSLIDSDSDPDSRLVATIPGDSDFVSGSDPAPLLYLKYYKYTWWPEQTKLKH